MGLDGAKRVSPYVFDPDTTLHAPHLIDLEVAHAVRRYHRDGLIGARRGSEALRSLRELSLERYSHEMLLGRVWQLRGNMSAYDAAYVALAETLSATLLTYDARLARAGGHRARIELVQ